MSLVCIRNIGVIEKQLLKSYPLRPVAFYSRRNNSKSSEEPYKYVRANKIKVEEEHEHIEGGPNWELLSPRGNRFYLPNLCGPAWQSNSTIIPPKGECLAELVDFTCSDPKKLWISSTPCPVLLKKSLVEIFPAPEMIGPEPLTIILLKSSSDFDTETAAKNFVLAAREICSRIRMNGYWADFMNCFSGKPFYSYSNGKLFKVDERCRGLGMKFENVNGCVVISNSNGTTQSDATKDNSTENLKEGFSGIIVSNIFSDLTRIQGLIGD